MCCRGGAGPRDMLTELFWLQPTFHTAQQAQGTALLHRHPPPTLLMTPLMAPPGLPDKTLPHVPCRLEQHVLQATGGEENVPDPPGSPLPCTCFPVYASHKVWSLFFFFLENERKPLKQTKGASTSSQCPPAPSQCRAGPGLGSHLQEACPALCPAAGMSPQLPPST